METGILVGRELQFSPAQRTELVTAASTLGYTSAWTNSSADTVGIETCRGWFEACGIQTGTAVIPTPTADLAAVARAACDLGEASGGKFVLGIGAGNMISPAWREANGLADKRPIGLMREHILYFKEHARVPVYLAGLGPRMLELIGELADGALPNWMDPQQLAWARERIAEGAAKSGRDPRTVKVGQSVRVAVDDDADVARRALAKASLSYALAKPNAPGGGHYRQSMTRMGLDEPLKELEAMRDQGASDDEIAAAFPPEPLRRLGAWGNAANARAELARLSEGLDVTIVRVVAARGDVASARAVIEACAPQ